MAMYDPRTDAERVYGALAGGPVYCQPWVEPWDGESCGYSVHLTAEDAARFSTGYEVVKLSICRHGDPTIVVVDSATYQWLWDHQSDWGLWMPPTWNPPHG